MIIKKTLKNGKTSITSSYFEDMRIYKMSLTDSKQSDYVSRKWRNDKARDFSELNFVTTIECMKLAKLGCTELRNFVNNLNVNQLENIKLNFGPCKDYESYETLTKIKETLEAKEDLTEKEKKELTRVTNEINDIDRFVEKQLELVKEV